MCPFLYVKKKCFTLHLKKTFVSLFDVSNTTLKMISLIEKIMI